MLYDTHAQNATVFKKKIWLTFFKTLHGRLWILQVQSIIGGPWVDLFSVDVFIGLLANPHFLWKCIKRPGTSLYKWGDQRISSYTSMHVNTKMIVYHHTCLSTDTNCRHKCDFAWYVPNLLHIASDKPHHACENIVHLYNTPYCTSLSIKCIYISEMLTSNTSTHLVYNLKLRTCLTLGLLDLFPVYTS